MYNHRGEPTGTNHRPTTQGEQFRRKAHPLQGYTPTMDTVGVYRGSSAGTHFFSADATGGGVTDSLTLPHHENSNFVGTEGQRYTFGRSRTSADVQPYNPKHHYGIAGAPLKDTPEDMTDSKFKGDN
jgi:hypothetical protein